MRQVDLDLERTHPKEPLVKARLDLIRTMLLRQVTEDPELNYCQGMNFVAGAFAVTYFNKDEAHERFRAFVCSLRGLWLPGFPLVEKGIQHFEALAEDRPW